MAIVLVFILGMVAFVAYKSHEGERRFEEHRRQMHQGSPFR